MRRIQLSHDYLSALCLELSLLLHSGITLEDGLRLLSEDEQESGSRALLEGLAQGMEKGQSLSQALAESKVFPPYLVQMANIGEKSGREEDVYAALADYYQGQSRLMDAIRSALLYPAVLLILMALVIGVLLIKVLPIFDQVFRQLGAGMGGLAGGLLIAGQWLRAALPALGVILGLLLVCALGAWLSPSFRGRLVSLWRQGFGDRGLAERIAGARFAAALALTMKSGLNMEEGLALASQLSDHTPRQKARRQRCLELLDQGAGLAEALRDSGSFPPIFCRMLGLGVKSGSLDKVMDEIARRLEDQVSQAISAKVSRIEPTLVIITSLLVGAIILAVMLPLMNIMSAMG